MLKQQTDLIINKKIMYNEKGEVKWKEEIKQIII